MKTVVLHIGMHKTGSSSIQTALDGYRGGGFEYAPLPPISPAYDDASNHSFQIRVAFVGSFQKLGNFLGESVDEAAFQAMRAQCREALAACLGRSKAGTLIISAEEITRFDRDEMQAMGDFFRAHGLKTTVYAYVRNPYDYVNSATQEIVKSGHAGDNLHPLSYRDNFAAAEAVFGAENVVYRLYRRESLVEGDSVADFCAWIGLNRRAPSALFSWRGLKKSLLRRTVEVNVSLSTDAVRCIYALNRHGKIHFGNPLLGHSRLALQKRLAQLLPGRFELPLDLIEQELDAADMAWMAARLQQPFEKPVTGDSASGTCAGLGEWLEKVSPELEGRLREHLAASGATVVNGAGFVDLVTQLYFECAREVSQGRSDYRAFDADRYLQKYPDVREAGLNPFGHYLMYGQNEGRDCT